MLTHAHDDISDETLRSVDKYYLYSFFGGKLIKGVEGITKEEQIQKYLDNIHKFGLLGVVKKKLIVRTTGKTNVQIEVDEKYLGYLIEN